jgi:hypothetical protein
MCRRLDHADERQHHHHSLKINMESAGKDQQLSFRLPEQLSEITDGGGRNDATDGDRYELWSVQLLGDRLTLQDLDGTHCSLDVSSYSQGSAGAKDEVLTSTTIQTADGGNEFALQLPPKRTSGDGPGAADSLWMRLIYPAKKKKRRTVTVPAADSSESDSDSDDDDRDQANDEFSHRPYGLPFLRHCSIISHHRPAKEPSGKDGPPAHVAIRRAYEPVPQRSGLKRRWVPFGGGHPPSAAAAGEAVASHRKGRSESAADGEGAVASTPNPIAIQRGPSATEADDDMGTNPRTAPAKSAPARQEAGQATAAQPEPRSSAPSPASDRSLEHKDKAARKAAKKEAKKAAKEKKKEEKKAKKRSKQEAA